MTIVEMLRQSSVLTLLGMGVVFGFLVILIVCVTAMGRVIRTFLAGKTPDAPAGGAGTPLGRASGTTVVAAVISAAVNEYRKTAGR
ncbi:MAG: OadG family protein [Treponema sp.]|jgi:oxaloacetate decarboxylase gamma subunit|nr:OadG family protein [Treponema sp.]